MAKMKRARQKFHAAAQKKKKDSTETAGDVEMADNTEGTFKMPQAPADPTAGVPRGENLFKDVDFSKLHLLNQKLPDFDARSSVTSKTFKGMNLKKKEKSQLRKEAWMAKMDIIQTEKKKAKKRKQNEKTVIVGDLTSMEDALPTLDLLMKKSGPIATDKQITKEKPRVFQKEKKRKKQELDDITLFNKVQAHPIFQEDRVNTVRDHLRAKLEQDAAS